MTVPITSFTGVNAFLSNFADCPITFDTMLYPSVEHAYQAAKTLDKPARELIRQASTPGRAKRLGRGLVLRDDWEAVKLEVMRNLLKQKFALPYFRSALLATGDAELIEGNTHHDLFWGAVSTDAGWLGQNHLGKILMEVRDGLKAW